MNAATAETAKAKAPSTGTGSEAAPQAVCVLDLGEQKRKRIRKLRRGKGPLMRKIEDAVADLREQGVVPAGAQTVVVLVREELSLAGIFDMDDDDDD